MIQEQVAAPHDYLAVRPCGQHVQPPCAAIRFGIEVAQVVLEGGELAVLNVRPSAIVPEKREPDGYSMARARLRDQRWRPLPQRARDAPAARGDRAADRHRDLRAARHPDLALAPRRAGAD